MTAAKFACQKLVNDMTIDELLAELQWDLALLKRLKKDHTDGTKVADRALVRIAEIKTRQELQYVRQATTMNTEGGNKK